MPVAGVIIERARRAVAVAVVSIVDVFGPDAVILGGGIAIAWGERLLGPAREAVATTGVPDPGGACGSCRPPWGTTSGWSARCRSSHRLFRRSRAPERASCGTTAADDMRALGPPEKRRRPTVADRSGRDDQAGSASTASGASGASRSRRIIERAPDVEVVAVNDLVATEMNALLFKHDSTYGAYPGTVEHTEDALVIDGRAIKVLQEQDPARCRGATSASTSSSSRRACSPTRRRRARHLEAGARKVIISAPAKNEDITIVLGVNEDAYDPATHHIISNASCTTNCLAPAAKVVHDNWTIKRGLMNTIHSYTNDQRVLDVAHKDPRRARAAGLNIIPTTTGAAKALALVIPDLKGKFDGFSLRVPDAHRERRGLHRPARAPGDRGRAQRGVPGRRRRSPEGHPGVSDEPLVSIGLPGRPRSSIIDAASTMSLGGDFVKVIAWYDNEWGYSCRVADLVAYVAARLDVPAAAAA